MNDSVSALLRAEANQPQRRSLHDQVNDAEIERLVAKFGPSIPPAGVDSGTAKELVAGPTSL